MNLSGVLDRRVFPKARGLCAWVALLAVVPPGRGATYYVARKDPNASDRNPGTERLPWRSLDFGARRLLAGDTLVVKAGHYYRHTGRRYEPGFHPARGGTPDRPITLKAHPGDEVVVMGGPTIDTPPGKFTNPAIGPGHDYVILDGFRVYGAVGLWKCKGCIVRNCEIWGGNDREFNCCIRMEYATGCVIRNNIVHDNDGRVSAPGAGGNRMNMPLVMEYDSGDCVIEHNEFYNAVGAAVFLKDNARNITVRGNLFWGRGGGVLTCVQDTGKNVVVHANIFRGLAGAAVHAHCSLQGLTVSNNTFYDNATDIHTWTSGTRDIRILNNVFVHARGGQLFLRVAPHGSDRNTDGALTNVRLHDYNCYHGRAEWKVNYRTVAGSLDAWRRYGPYGFDKHSLLADPKFADAAKGDFRLAKGSPCRRAGKDEQALGAHGKPTARIGVHPKANPWMHNRVKVCYHTPKAESGESAGRKGDSP